MDKPRITCNLNGEAHEMTWDNTTMFLHKEDFYDHIWICREGNLGSYILKLTNPEIFENLADLLYEHEFPYHFAPEPSEHDRRIIDGFIQKEVEEDLRGLQGEG
jgi:hypothetical protein